MSLNPPLRDWRGTRVWIVGASSGIGAALAVALLERGARVAVSARNREALEALVAGRPEALAVPADVTVAGDLARAHDEILRVWQDIDLVVLNAGSHTPMRSWAIDTERVRRLFEVNVLGVYAGVAAVVPRMIARGRGAIAIVASVAGYRGLPTSAAYGPSKAALINLAETLFLDLRPKGIGVHLVSPGFVATPLTAQNEFPMPDLISAESAAEAMIHGLASGSFEIRFPRRFATTMATLRVLPYRLYFALIHRFTGL